MVPKNEMVMSVLHDLKVKSKEPGGQTLTVANYMFNSAGDGKDICDITAANINAKAEKEVNSGDCNTDTPANFAKAIALGNGVINSVLMLGPIVSPQGGQKKLEKKLVPSISKIHDFQMKPEGAKVRHICKVGEGQSVKFAPVKVETFYKAKVMNKEHLEENGQPRRRTTIPVEKVGGHANSKRKANTNDPQRRLSIQDFASHKYIQRFGMETVEDFQPDFDMGGKYLLERMELPIFSQTLKDIAVATKRSPLNETLQSSLKVGFALPNWGEGKNSPTKGAKNFVEDLFNQGQKQKPVPAADAVVLMQEKLDSTGAPMFDASTFLDEDQIKSMFGTISHSRKRSLTGARKPGSVTDTVGVDFDDEDNGEDKQAFENALAHAAAEDETAAAGQDAVRIQNDLETADDADSDEHPIKIGEVNLCEIAEKIDWALNVDKQLSNLTKQQQEAILAIIEGDKYEPPVKRRRTMKKMKSSIFDYVRKTCYCVAFSPWQGR
jgi:hypothetical protein